MLCPKHSKVVGVRDGDKGESVLQENRKTRTGVYSQFLPVLTEVGSPWERETGGFEFMVILNFIQVQG